MTMMVEQRIPEFRFAAAHTLEVVDSHTCGQPTRVILSGADLPAGIDPVEGRALLERDRDWIRRLAVFEPRGHRSMFVAALIAPSPDVPHYGVVYMDANAYPDMCGHATIGVATTLFELGLIGPEDPAYTGSFAFALATPAGLLSLRATLVDGRCEAVAFQTPYAYHLASISLALPNGQTPIVDIAYGGQYYAFLPAEAVGLTVEPNAIDALIAAAATVRPLLAAALTSVDPRTGIVPSVGNIVWTGAPTDPAAAGLNVPVSSGNSFDRSPCGTATCARMATLVAHGTLAIGAPFVNQGIMGTLYRGMAVAAADPALANGAAIVPEVEGSAWITARAQLRLDSRDPLGRGYLIGNGAAML